jgi:ubiquinone/menaquinone biosynthesis C-methylase UbiE
VASFWANRVLPHLVEKACRSTAILEERKRWVPRAHGNVLEIGVGSGLNLPFYDGAQVTKVTGIDPSAPLLARANRRATDAPFATELVCGHGERLPFESHSFDSAVVTYSLCSVDDPIAVLAEVRRALRPEGELLFVEHGLARDAATQRRQRMLTPVWRRVAGGCRLDRDIGCLLDDGGFEVADLSADYAEGAKFLSFTYAGTARPHQR